MVIYKPINNPFLFYAILNISKYNLSSMGTPITQISNMKTKQVLYDGKCGLCNKEILYYQTIAPKGKFEWIDITITKNLARYPAITLRDALMSLHVVEGGNIKSGVDAFIAIWSELSYLKILSLIVSLPIVYQIACLLYRLFAYYRFKNLPHCQLAEQKEGK